MEHQDSFEAVIEQMLALCKAQYGDAIKSFWFYEASLCPCCAKRQIDVFKHKQKDSLSLNAFIYREMGVLIGYVLCGVCATDLLRTATKRQTIMHERIEKNLVEAYHKHLSHAN